MLYSLVSIEINHQGGWIEMDFPNYIIFNSHVYYTKFDIGLRNALFYITNFVAATD